MEAAKPAHQPTNGREKYNDLPSGTGQVAAFLVE